MKKAYKSPELEVMNVETGENILNNSFGLNIHDDQNIDSEANVWSNQESDLNIW